MTSLESERPLAVRWAKIALLAAMALYFTVVVFNNVTDFGSNYQFVRHVLTMDTTFPGNHGMWRAMPWPPMHLVFYIGIICWETLCAALGWRSVAALLRARHATVAKFARAKRLAAMALTAGMMLWFVAFITVGGEWFLMWQSRIWNGQDAAFRMFMIEAAVMILLLLPEGVQ